MQKVTVTGVWSLFVDVTRFSRFQGDRSALESPLHPRKARWGSVFPGLAVGSTAGHRAPFFLRMLTISLMNLRRNTAAEMLR